MYTGLLIILVPLMVGYLLPWHQPALLQRVNRLLSLLIYAILFLWVPASPFSTISAPIC